MIWEGPKGLELPGVLRASSVHDAVIWALRINDITDRATFSTKEGLKGSTRDLGADVRVPPEREMSRLINPWRQPNVQCDPKHQTEATARAHGAPISVLTCGWRSIIDAFKHGVEPAPLNRADMPDDVPLAHSCFESFRRAPGRRSDESGVIHVVILAQEAAVRRSGTGNHCGQWWPELVWHATHWIEPRHGAQWQLGDDKTDALLGTNLGTHEGAVQNLS